MPLSPRIYLKVVILTANFTCIRSASSMFDFFLAQSTSDLLFLWKNLPGAFKVSMHLVSHLHVVIHSCDTGGFEFVLAGISITDPDALDDGGLITAKLTTTRGWCNHHIAFFRHTRQHLTLRSAVQVVAADCMAFNFVERCYWHQRCSLCHLSCNVLKHDQYYRTGPCVSFSYSYSTTSILYCTGLSSGVSVAFCINI